MEAIVKKAFVHAATKKHYEIGERFKSNKEEIERINNILVNALEILEPEAKEPTEAKTEATPKRRRRKNK